MPHIHEKIDFTVEVFVVYNNRVLLRKHDKYNMWLGVGGHVEHVELYEDPNEAAIREVKEEVGLGIELYPTGRFPPSRGENYRELIPPIAMNRHRIPDTDHEHVTLVYVARSTTDRVVQSKKERSEEYRWFTKEDLESPDFGVRDDIRNYARTALEILRE